MSNISLTAPELDWPSLKKALDVGNLEQAAKFLTVAEYSQPAKLARLLAVAVEEESRLAKLVAAGEKFYPVVQKLRRELELTAACQTTIGEIQAKADNLADLRLRLDTAVNAVAEAEAARHGLLFLHQQFAELFGLPPGKMITGGFTNAIGEAAKPLGINIEVLDSWRYAPDDPRPPAARRRLLAMQTERHPSKRNPAK